MNHEILKEKLDEDTKALIESMEKEIKTLKNEIEYLKSIITNKNRKIFGASSEQVDANQLSFFNEAEKYSDSSVEEPTVEEITYKRAKKNTYKGKKDNLANLERVVIEHKLEGEDLKCKECGGELVEIGIKSRKEIIKYIPPKFIVEEHITYSYACRDCEEEKGKSNIVSSQSPSTVFYNSMASHELIAHTLALKYQYAVPFYRQEAYFDIMGATLSRQTLCNWTMAAAEVLKPIYDHMKKDLLNRNYIHADETTIKVVNDNGTESKSLKYMWLYMSDTDSKPVILYDYQNTRSSSCPKNFLGDFKGFLQTDGYSGYNSVENAKRVYCLAHIRRKFYDIIVELDEEALKKSRAIIGFNFCEQIYKLEKEIREAYSSEENYYEIRFKIRAEKLAPLIDEFMDYVEREIKDALPRSPLGKALDYAKKHLPGIKNVLLDGCLEVDNNAAERAIKPFVIGRKNFLFANTAKGAVASSIIYSIIETAKANNLVVEKYLVYLFDNLSKIDMQDVNILDNLMPWSNKIPEDIKIKEKK